MSLLPERPTKQSDELSLFELKPDWSSDWWGMPSYVMGDAEPTYQITMNFMTLSDLLEFAQRLELKITAQTKGAWFPQSLALASH